MVGALLFASCSDSTSFVEEVGNGPNLAGFSASSKTVSHEADGSSYKVTLPVTIFGPSVPDLSGDFTATIKAVAPTDSTAKKAKAGLHYRIDDKTITLKASNDYEAEFTFTMLTKGVSASAGKSPVLTLKVTKVKGTGNVLGSGKPIEVTLDYESN